MKTAPKLRSSLVRVTCACLVLTALTGCELPPRESWALIQRDGLLTYWSREYHPTLAPSRYLAPNGRPLMLGQVPRTPYRPVTSSRTRYMASGSTVPYRPRSVSPRPSSSRTEVVQSQDHPKIDLDPVRPSPSTPAPKPDAPKPSISMDSLPYGMPVPGRPGMVNSPFAEKQQLVDVTGMAPGEAVKDPYSGKLFRVPPTQQAAAEKTAPPAPTTEEEVKPKP